MTSPLKETLRSKKVLLLTYYYEYADRNLPQLKFVKDAFLGAFLDFDAHFRQPLERLFGSVVVFDYLKRRTQVSHRQLNEEILALVKRERPDYVIWTSFYFDVDEATFQAIRDEGVTVIGWYFDDEWRFQNYSKFWTPCLDYSVTNARMAVPWYRELGAKVVLGEPIMGYPPVRREWPRRNYRYDVSFVGARRYADREQILDALQGAQITVAGFGMDWGNYVSYEEMREVFWQSRINLNFSRCFGSDSKQIKGRIFETLISGGFVLTEYAEGTEDYFEPDKEIATFRTVSELIDKIRYYLRHEQERERIAQAGWQRANQCYSREVVISGILERILQEQSRTDHPRAPMSVPPSPESNDLAARYHVEWAKGFLALGQRDLYNEAIALAVSRSPACQTLHEVFERERAADRISRIRVPLLSTLARAELLRFRKPLDYATTPARNILGRTRYRRLRDGFFRLRKLLDGAFKRGLR